jgi:uncharacterized lipoprotein NlpE involved in copper resistance
MRLLLLPSIALPLCIAAGCRPAPAPLPVIVHADGQVAWRGTMPCADCAGIAVHLVLEREGGERRYQLVETYLLADGRGARFVEHGQWRQQADLLQLHGSDDSRRTYAVAAGGHLQARDSHGRRLPVQDDAMLSPIVP